MDNRKIARELNKIAFELQGSKKYAKNAFADQSDLLLPLLKEITKVNRGYDLLGNTVFFSYDYFDDAIKFDVNFSFNRVAFDTKKKIDFSKEKEEFDSIAKYCIENSEKLNKIHNDCRKNLKNKEK